MHEAGNGVKSVYCRRWWSVLSRVGRVWRELKIRWWRHREGSRPSPGTIEFAGLRIEPSRQFAGKSRDLYRTCTVVDGVLSARGSRSVQVTSAKRTSRAHERGVDGDEARGHRDIDAPDRTCPSRAFWDHYGLVLRPRQSPPVRATIDTIRSLTHTDGTACETPR